MGEPKTVHIWMPNSRSLCDRRAEQPDFPFDAKPEEVEKHNQLQETAPACGACLLIAFWIRGEAAKLFAGRETVWPKTVKEAWRSLRETGWDRTLLQLKPKMPSDIESFDLFTVHLNSQYVQDEVAAKRERDREYREALLQRARELHGTPGDEKSDQHED